MKFLTLIISLSMTVSSHASLFGNSGHGQPSDICAYNQSSDRTHKPASVDKAEKKLSRAESKLKNLEKKLDKLDCEPCEEVFKKYIRFYPKEKDSYNSYIRHLEGGSSCGFASNVEIYNHYAYINQWETIKTELSRSRPIRNIAGGDGDELGGGDNDLPGEDPVRRDDNDDDVVIPGPDANCPKYAGPEHSLKPEFCEKLSPHISRKNLKECHSCLSPSRKNSSSKLGKCLYDRAHLEEQIATLEDEIEDLEEDLEETVDRAEESGEASVCVDCVKDTRSNLKKATPLLLGGAAGLGIGYLVKKAGDKSFRQRQQENRLIQLDNNRKGFPSPPVRFENNSSRNGLLAGLVGGVGVYSVAKAAGASGCASNSIFGNLLTGGAGAGNQVGGATGIGSVLAGLIGGNGPGNVGGTNGVVTGQGAVPPGYVVGPNGQLVFVGGAAGGGAQGGPSEAQIQAEIAAAQQRAADLSRFQAWQQSRNSIISTRDAELRALGQSPILNQQFVGGGNGQFISSGGQIIQGRSGGAGAGVLSGVARSLVQGGVNLNVGVRAGVGGGAGVVPFRTANNFQGQQFQNQQFQNQQFQQQQFQNQQFPGGVPQAPQNFIPNNGNVAPPTNTQPSGVQRL